MQRKARLDIMDNTAKAKKAPKAPKAPKVKEIKRNIIKLTLKKTQSSFDKIKKFEFKLITSLALKSKLFPVFCKVRGNNFKNFFGKILSDYDKT